MNDNKEAIKHYVEQTLSPYITNGEKQAQAKKHIENLEEQLDVWKEELEKIILEELAGL